MQSQIELLFEIERCEARVMTAPRPEADTVVVRLEAAIARLPTPLREQYTWLRSWTKYPIARLRDCCCTGCGEGYEENHAFLLVTQPQVAYCEHCMRILLLRDLSVVEPLGGGVTAPGPAKQTTKSTTR